MSGGYKPRLHDNQIAWYVDDRWLIGYIYDKYQGTIAERFNIGYGGGKYGDGGIDRRNNPITVDYYIIKEHGNKNTHHVLCSEVCLYDEKVHVNKDPDNSNTEKESKISVKEALG